jgi:hypothetical protein
MKVGVMSWDGRDFVRDFINNSTQSSQHVAANFAVYANRQDINRFLALHELFKLQLPVKGSSVECGVFGGSSLFTFAHLSGIYEPSNYHRKIIGFDTFEGFPGWSDIDEFEPSRGIFRPEFDTYKELSNAAVAFQKNHYLEGEEKISLIKGDATKTIPEFLEKNKHFICSMLYLDFDIYEPTKVALSNFLPRMPKGSILVFDEIHNPHWPGETQALVDVLGINNVEIRNFSFNPNIAYIKL